MGPTLWGWKGEFIGCAPSDTAGLWGDREGVRAGGGVEGCEGSG